MKAILTGLGSVLLLACAVAAEPVVPAATAAHDAHQYKTRLLSRADFDALLAAPGSLLIIDVRRPDELTAKGGFPVYLSIQYKELGNSLAFIPRDRTIVTVSNHAGRALPAGDLLADAGFHVAGAIGVEGYEKEGGTLTRIAPPPPKPDAPAAK